MNDRCDLLSTPTYFVPDHLKIPANTTPAEAAAGIVSYFRYVQNPWSDVKLKKLAEYIIDQCNGSILDSTREIVVSYFAERLAMDQTTFLSSEQVHQSFAKSLGPERDYVNLSFKLNRDQAVYIANAVFGKTSASNLEHDTRDQRGSIQEFSFRVIQKICQMKGQAYSIRNFLDQLENPGVST